jgi:enoyl-CoA hydratase
MILTGRPVGAEVALAFGLANRVVEPGMARKEAEALAQQISEFPKVCMRSDRQAVYRGFDRDFDSAMKLEFELGLKVIGSGETQQGAGNFVSGKGKHGEF